MIANACFNIFIIVKYPEFDEIQRTDAQQDIKDYLVANPAFSQQFISLGVQQTASIASSNPGVHTIYVLLIILRRLITTVRRYRQTSSWIVFWLKF